MSDAAPAAPVADAPAEAAPGEGQDPSLPGQQEEAPPEEAKAPPPPKKWKLRGREYESPDELAAEASRLELEAQQNAAYRKYVEEAHQEKKKAQALLKRLKEDTAGALSEAGVDPLELALKRVREEMELEAMTPEQRRARQLEQKVATLEADKKKLAEEKDAQELSVFKGQQREYYVRTINEALQHTKLPPTAEVQSRMARLLKVNLKYNVDVPPALIARLVEEEIQGEHVAMDTDEAFNAQAYIQKYPKRAEAIRRANLEALKAVPPPAAPTPGLPPKPQPVQRLTQAQLDAMMKDVVGGL